MDKYKSESKGLGVKWMKQRNDAQVNDADDYGK